MKFFPKPLSRAEIVSVIEGKGAAQRVPSLFHMWVHAESFREQKPALETLLGAYPQDVQRIQLKLPQVFDAPEDDSEYRWANFADPYLDEEVGIDETVAIRDWNTQLEDVLHNFPDPEYPGIFTDNPPENGCYRLGQGSGFIFERFRSLRGMTNTLKDLYEHPDEIHLLLDKIASFYCRVLERAKHECAIDGFFTSDELGTQNSTFFSIEFFDVYFLPYYRRVIEKCHELDIHFWLHSRGNIRNLIPRYIGLGVDVLQHTMAEREIAEQFGNQICIWSGFDVQQFILCGTPETVRKEVRHLIDTYFREDGRFMMTTGNFITPDCPLPSLEALLDEAYAYGTKKCSMI